MSLPPGSVVLVRYDAELFHERLVCGFIRGCLYLICTAQYDFYPEDVSSANPDVTFVRFFRRQPDGTAMVPPGVAQIHHFAALAVLLVGRFLEPRSLDHWCRSCKMVRQQWRGFSSQENFPVSSLGATRPAPWYGDIDEYR